MEHARIPAHRALCILQSGLAANAGGCSNDGWSMGASGLARTIQTQSGATIVRSFNVLTDGNIQ